MSKASWLSVNSMCCQLISSRLYSSCSILKTWRTKNCCRFSFAKLMHSCSKLQQEWTRISTSLSRKCWNINGLECSVYTYSPVNSEILKAENVEQAYRPTYSLAFCGRNPKDGSIDFIHYPHKQSPIDSLMETENSILSGYWRLLWQIENQNWTIYGLWTTSPWQKHYGHPVPGPHWEEWTHSPPWWSVYVWSDMSWHHEGPPVLDYLLLWYTVEIGNVWKIIKCRLI